MFSVCFLFESIPQFHKNERCRLAMFGGKCSCVFVFCKLIETQKMHSHQELCIYINDQTDRECCKNLALRNIFTDIIMF